jgi:hypothetical protein
VPMSREARLKAEERLAARQHEDKTFQAETRQAVEQSQGVACTWPPAAANHSRP